MSSPAVLLAAVSGLTRPLVDWQVTAGYAIFAVSHLVFALGKLPGMKIDRPGMAIIGAVLMVAFRIVPAAEALRFIDFGTLVLLFSMMLVVGYLHLTGFFEWVTEQIVTRLKPHHLLPTVIFITGLLSAFFVNDIICLVMVPFAARGIKIHPWGHLRFCRAAVFGGARSPCLRSARQEATKNKNAGLVGPAHSCTSPCGETTRF
jgi:di/tricarboxylate transporter